MEEKRRQAQNFMRRGGLVTIFLMVTWALAVVKLIPLTGIVSEQGIAVFAVSYESFLVLSLLSNYFIPGFVSKRISLRLSRGQYKNARTVFYVSLLASLALSVVLAIFFFFIADTYASVFLQIPYAAFAMKCICAAFPVYGTCSVLKGYFEGMGTMMPTCVAGLFEQLVAVPVSLIFAYRMHAYGQKVSDFLLEPNYTTSYSSAAIGLSVLIGMMAELLFLLLVYFLYQRTFRKNVMSDMSKSQDSFSDLALQFFQSVFPAVFGAIFLFADTCINQKLYFSFALKKGTIDTALTNYGVFYGKYRPLILMAAILITAACHFLTPVISKLYAREAYHQLNLEFQSGIRNILIFGGAASLVFTILSTPLAGLLYKQNTQQAARLLLIGSFAILCYALAIYTTAFVKGLELPLISAGAWLLALLLQSILTYFFLTSTSMGIATLAMMNVVYPLLITGVNFLIIRKKIL